MRTALFILFCLCLQMPATSATLKVPTQFSTIQGALDLANPGDTIVVLPGVYFENIDFKGKAVLLKSESGPESTIIDGSAPHNPNIASVALFYNHEGADTVIEGFTLIHGKGVKIAGIGSHGGGIFCWQSSPTIRNNIIDSNMVTADGGAIYCGESAPLIENNLIIENISAMHGGGIACMNGSQPEVKGNTILRNFTGLIAGKGWGGGIGCKSSQPQIIENRISENIALIGGGGIWCKKTDPEIVSNRISSNLSGLRGGGIHIINQCHEVTITNNLIWQNKSETGGGINYSGSTYKIIANNTLSQNEAYSLGGGFFCDDASEITVSNLILYNNQAPSGPEIWTGGDTILTIRNSDCLGGEELVEVHAGTFTWGPGMLDMDPLFVNPMKGDFHLTHPSPCRDSGYNDPLEPLPALDFESDPRMAGDIPDMGADEFYTHLYYEEGLASGEFAKGFYVGDPLTDPVVLLVGTYILNTPFPTPYGDFYLGSPVVVFGYVGAIPSDGVLMHTAEIPIAFPAPAQIPLQAVFDNKLSNLFVLQVNAP